MSRTTDPPNDPMAHLDTQRFDTRALDLGALRAIQDAYATGIERGAAGGDAAKASSVGLAGDGAVEPAKDTVAEPVGDTLRDPAPPDSLRFSGGAGRSDTERAVEAGGPTATPPGRFGGSGPPPAAGSAVTVEVDYSPASRMRRARSMRVQRTARIVTLACVAASALLGLWAAVRASRRDAHTSGDRMPAPALSAAASLATGAPAVLTSPRAAPEPAASASVTFERSEATAVPAASASAPSERTVATQVPVKPPPGSRVRPAGRRRRGTLGAFGPGAAPHRGRAGRAHPRIALGATAQALGATAQTLGAIAGAAMIPVPTSVR